MCSYIVLTHVVLYYVRLVHFVCIVHFLRLLFGLDLITHIAK